RSALPAARRPRRRARRPGGTRGIAFALLLRKRDSSAPDESVVWRSPAREPGIPAHLVCRRAGGGAPAQGFPSHTLAFGATALRMGATPAWALMGGPGSDPRAPGP